MSSSEDKDAPCRFPIKLQPRVYQNLVPATGFEPVTIRLEGGCSIQLSYADMGIASIIAVYSIYLCTE